MTIEGRIALVTGAGGQGMGRSIALTLARDGADIVLNYHRRAEHAEATVGAIEAMGRRVLRHQADVSDAAQVDAMFAAAVDAFGRVDIVVNSAGGPWKPQDVAEIDPAHLRRVLASEIEATYYLLRAALPGMRARGYGRFVSIGGHMADDWRFGPPDAPLDYPLGKAARHWLTRTLAPRESAHGITINAVAPGPQRPFSNEE
jgi:NAD(P)-dependent dehydrogenase (short-subunit alcohol dehydrogenase family)